MTPPQRGVDLLLRRGADVDLAVGGNRTPLNQAIAGGHDEFAQMLRNAGAID